MCIVEQVKWVHPHIVEVCWINRQVVTDVAKAALLDVSVKDIQSCVDAEVAAFDPVPPACALTLSPLQQASAGELGIDAGEVTVGEVSEVYSSFFVERGGLSAST